MRPYADTNFFARLYLSRSDSQEVQRLLAVAEAEESPPLPISWLHRMETLNALQLYVFSGRTGGKNLRITPEQAAVAQATFREDLAKGSLLRAVRIEPVELERQFEALALRHTARHGFRSYDVLHVASAIVLECDTFWSFDAKASKLASLEGLKTR